VEQIALILVAYKNTEKEIFHALDSWASQERPPDAAYVVMNSPLESAVLRDRAVVLEPGENIGFTSGVNQAACKIAELPDYTHILISNIDTEILSRETVGKLLQAFAVTPDAAFISPGITLYPDTSLVWYRGAHICRPAWISRQPGIGTPWLNPSGEVTETGYFSGCCALIDLGKFVALRCFDEELFMYYDEAEIAERGRQRGWRSYFIDEPLIAHAKPGRKFSPTEAYYHARNSALLLGRYEKGFRRLVGRIVQLGVALPQLSRCEGRSGYRSYLLGMKEGCCG
jgi:GT2 family glycosyltransferase